MRKVAQDHPLASYPAWSPSGLIQAGRPHGHAMTRQDLQELKLAYVAAAEQAQSLGADGVEVHAAHGYLLDQFLWRRPTVGKMSMVGAPSPSVRAIQAEIVAAIRVAVGPDFVISYRFSQFKEVDYGAAVAESPEDLGAMLRLLRDRGVDMFNVSSRRFHKTRVARKRISAIHHPPSG